MRPFAAYRCKALLRRPVHEELRRALRTVDNLKRPRHHALREARAQAAAVQQQQQMVQGLAANAAGLSRRPEQGSLMGKVMDNLSAMG